MNSGLCVVIPVYNEQDAIGAVIEEWLPVLRGHCDNLKILVLNDGSTDRTASVLKSIAAQYPEVIVVEKINSGHGQTCLEGYKIALEEGWEWIFQVDSDGQCDPRFFAQAWEMRKHTPVILGKRIRREDGLCRALISCVTRWVTFAASGTWVDDPNVPYRLIHRKVLENVISKIPCDFHLANIALAVECVRASSVSWVPIFFRERQGGSPSVKALNYAQRGIELFIQLRRLQG